MEFYKMSVIPAILADPGNHWILNPGCPAPSAGLPCYDPVPGRIVQALYGSEDYAYVWRKAYCVKGIWFDAMEDHRLRCRVIAWRPLPGGGTV